MAFDPFVGTAGPLTLIVDGGLVTAGGQVIGAATTNLTLGASTVNYVYFNPQTSTVTSNTTGFPPYCYAICIATTGAAAISFIQDVRNGVQIDGSAMFFTTVPAVLTTCNATVQNVTTFALPGGLLNYLGKTVRFKSAGVLNTSSGSGLQLGLQLSGTNVCLINTANISTTLTNQPWATEMTLQVANTGATGNIEGHGTITAQLTTAAANLASTVSQDLQTAVSANINLTQPLTLGFIALTNGAIVNFTARTTTLEILN